MADLAKVKSVESLEYFRAALITFHDKAKKALSSAEGAVKKARYWVEQEQWNSWSIELRKRTRHLELAEQELFSAKLSEHRDAMLEQKAVRRCKAAVEEAELKLRAIKRWTREFDRVFDSPVKGLGHLDDFLTNEIPRGIAWLAQAIKTLDAYTREGAPPAAAGPVAITDPAP
jgi:hypothetical protein